jgi:hypothetical protein
VNGDKDNVPTAESVSCLSREPVGEGTKLAKLELPARPGVAPDAAGAGIPLPPSYQKFTSQDELGHFLLRHYKIRAPRDLMSCEVCHR